ncbi:hypothetical protein MYCTH_2315319 [Thermothelomyces thermophilus ATCC 42464]|uniref:Uncharacterized protein n=1 Tax=Thermothelomyces thermophilus (strain ATCC 42464 / BCRC 31852 / DSM 1799) TaxID=573729 RepID=G2QBY4_THET4|nr:uncharacterized protein MYCTH_2315319 [Thermothelomyces thermophilus ATCC 42464]AEO58066.1 hypothetical protein MYCTH_2315319 [Thermothelomyces thermophilus ATCC 42464]
MGKHESASWAAASPERIWQVQFAGTRSHGKSIGPDACDGDDQWKNKPARRKPCLVLSALAALAIDWGYLAFLISI